MKQMAMLARHEKTAANLAVIEFPDDAYHKGIQTAARRIVEMLPASLAEVLTYQTGYASGSTVWSSIVPYVSYTVYTDGRVAKNYG